MARTEQEREQWFADFAAKLGKGTYPMNAADGLVSCIFTYNSEEKKLEPAFKENPFAGEASAQTRANAIDKLMDAFEKGEVFIPCQGTKIAQIKKDDEGKIVPAELKEPEAPGNPVSRFFKRAVNSIFKNAFAEDVAKEKQWLADVEKVNHCKNDFDRVKRMVDPKIALILDDAAKQRDLDISANIEIGKITKTLNRIHSANAAKIPNDDRLALDVKLAVIKYNKDEAAFNEYHRTSKTDEYLTEIYNKVHEGMNEREVENLRQFTVSYVLANIKSEEVETFLKNPSVGTGHISDMIDDAQFEFMEAFMQNKKNGKDFDYVNPGFTAKAVQKLSQAINHRDSLDDSIIPAAKCGALLSKALNKIKDEPQAKQLRDYDKKLMDSLQTMAEVYVEGMEAKKDLLSMNAFTGGKETRRDYLAKFVAMEQLNKQLDNNHFLQNKSKDTITKQREYFVSKEFTKKFLQEVPKLSAKLNALAEKKPNAFRKEWLNMINTDFLPERFVDNVTKEIAGVLKNRVDTAEKQKNAPQNRLEIGTKIKQKGSVLG